MKERKRREEKRKAAPWATDAACTDERAKDAHAMTSHSTTTEKVTHTPGPWEDVQPNRKEFGVYRIATIAAHCADLFDGGSSAGVETVAAVDAANARLIAAAPALLASLREFVALYKGTHDLLSAGVLAKVDRARAVLAKVDGAR